MNSTLDKIIKEVYPATQCQSAGQVTPNLRNWASSGLGGSKCLWTAVQTLVALANGGRKCLRDKERTRKTRKSVHSTILHFLRSSV